MTNALMERPIIARGFETEAPLPQPLAEHYINESIVINLPGVIDPHVHLREPGATHKETFETGTKAAIAGGVIALYDMPNNPGQFRVISQNSLVNKRALARGAAYTDIGFYAEYKPEKDNIGQLTLMEPMASGYKFYVEPTNENNTLYAVNDFRGAVEHIHRISPDKPIAAHIEDETAEEMMHMVAVQNKHPFHLPHANNRFLVETALNLIDRYDADITIGMCPQHLFMTEEDVARLGWRGRMKPPLATQEDQDYLWSAVDNPRVLFETDHAPHTNQEKDQADRDNPDADPGGVTSYGVPGLEAALPLYLEAVSVGKLTIEKLVDKTTYIPARRFGYRIDPTTKISVAMEQYEFSEADVRSKCGWSPYVGRLVTGRVVKVNLHGETVYSNGRFLNNHGTGVILPDSAVA